MGFTVFNPSYALTLAATPIAATIADAVATPVNEGIQPMPKALPRVTYSNVSADFAGVHALLDARISTFCKEMLGWTWSNHVGGINEALGATYYAVSPIDTNVHLGSFHAADAAGVDRAVRSARAAFDYWGRLPWP